MEWLHTDNLQRVLKLNENEFVVVETVVDRYDEQLKDEERYATFLVHEIDIKQYSQDELDIYVESYYRGGMEEIIREYNSDWKIVVAEIIAETDSENYWNTDKTRKYEHTLDIEKDLDKFILELNY